MLEEAGTDFSYCRGNSSPRARTSLSGMGRKSRRGSDADNAPDASSRALDEGSTRSGDNRYFFDV